MFKKTILILIVLYSYTHCINDRSSSAPYIAGDSFRAIAEHLFDETNTALNPDSVKANDIIFVKTDYLETFFKTIHPLTDKKYILITHNSDYGAPGQFAHYLDDPKIIHWFGQNPTIKNHPKFTPIPIGIANNHWPHGKTATFDTILQNPRKRKKNIVGINFVISTNFTERKRAYDYFIAQPYCSEIFSPDHATYLQHMKSSQFIICPEGNGLDCHRTWEALLMGAIPIVTSSMLDPIFADLPVIIVNDWHEITKDFLEKKYAQFQKNQSQFNLKKIYFDYWQQLIHSYKQIP